ncbi:MAG: dihydroneopterin aldolase [Bacteroidia bacterium]|nr:dihydroneopterin aldolase [Bacteroidia bacterium]
MTGTIFLHDLKILCIVGIHPKERDFRQALFLDIEVDQDFASAAGSEYVGDTVDYSVLAEEVDKLLTSRQYQLIETAAEEVCQTIFGKWPQVTRCKVKIKKPAAVPQAAFAAVAVERFRAQI